jgi:asparagine synthase (glutamine-hydrolysing)
MCGLACVASVGGNPLPAEANEILTRMARMLAHRGPDETEFLRPGPVGMAFTRLSLVDPAGGGQPLHSDDGAVVLIANGEVYNHRELAASLRPGTRMRTRSDCEVLVHLYQQQGLRFLDRVAGMFALILWDRKASRLILARDRFGIKPLYRHRDRDRIVVSSEIKALFADPATPRQLDWPAALAHPLFTAAPVITDTPPATWFRGVELVPAGTILEIDLLSGAERTHRYWRFPGTPRDIPASDEELIDEYRGLLAAAVRDTATADAEVGLFLSGGVDSAAVAAFAAPVRRLHTFTVLSASTLHNGDAESGHRVAERLGHENHQVLFEAERVPGGAEWKRLLWLLETPECGPEQFYKHELHRYARQVRPELKGMLLGAASDEFHGGYSTEYAPGRHWVAFTDTLREMLDRGRLWHSQAPHLWQERFGVPVLRYDNLAAPAERAGPDPYEAYLAWEYNKIQHYNCWHEDRTAAGSGIEARVPFLDHRLVELVASIPPERRQRLLWDKRIVREAVRDLLPADLVARAKVPFYYGEGTRYTHRTFARMLAQDGGALVEEALAAPGGKDFLDPAGARAALRTVTANPDSEQAVLLLRLVNLGLLDQMLRDLPPPLVDQPAAALPRSVLVADWSRERGAIEGLVLDRPALRGDLVPRLLPGVELLRPVADPELTYVAVDGAIEYVLSEENAAWRGFVERVDGVRSLGELAASLGCGLDALAADLYEALDCAVLLLEPGRRGAPERTATAGPRVGTQ